MALLAFSIALFAVAMFCYSYSNASSVEAFGVAFPYRGVALLFVGVGSVSMVTASISYSKKTKEIIQ